MRCDPARPASYRRSGWALLPRLLRGLPPPRQRSLLRQGAAFRWSHRSISLLDALPRCCLAALGSNLSEVLSEVFTESGTECGREFGLFGYLFGDRGMLASRQIEAPNRLTPRARY